MNIRASVVISAAASMFYFGALVAQEPPPKPGGIEGAIAQIGTGGPLTGARVTLIVANPPRGSGSPTPVDLSAMTLEARISMEAAMLDELRFYEFTGRGAAGPAIPPATTDDKGRFSFPNLAAGTYRLQVQANGYVPMEYGQRYLGGPGAPIILAAGESKTDVAVQLTPAGNISGRLRDTFEQPLSNIPVQLLRPSYGATGERSLQVVGGARTDDRGEYRIYWVTPGRYYLRAGGLTNGLDAVIGLGGPGAGVGGPNTNEVVSNVAATFFPGVPDAAGARAVEVTPGGDLSGVDWPLPPPIPGRRVRGKLVDSRTGRPPANAYVMITPVNPDSGPSVLEAYGLGIGLSYNPSTGIVDFKSVLPGVYTIGAVMEEPLDRSEGPPLQTGPTMSFNVNPNVRIVSGSTSVTVAEKDVDDVVVVVAPTGALSGRLRVEGSFPAGPRGAQRFGVNLNPIRRNDVVNYYGGYSNASATADETFKLTVSAGEYRLTVQLPTNGYIKSAQLDGADVLESPLVLTGTPSGSLDIVVSSNSGQIQGSLVDERSEPVPRMQVVLVPNRSRGRFDLYKTTITDAAGSFTINGVTPGDYKVFSWESIERFSWFDPQVLERWEDRGAPVHVSESSVENVQVRLIPPGGAQ